MLQRPRTLPAGFIAPCLPTKTSKLPSGELWVHEIKHDGFRIIARKDGERVRLYSRPGNDLTRRFPLIAEALSKNLLTLTLHLQPTGLIGRFICHRRWLPLPDGYRRPDRSPPGR
jgi:ATP dependent DNA ligase domain